VTASPGDIAAGVDVLRRGGLVAFPTETVYGLGADASRADSLVRLYRVKGRPSDHPVIVHIARATDLEAYARNVPDAANMLARRFWPGPLTLVLHKDPTKVDDAATGGRATVGLRVPDHPIALALLDAFGGGIAAPSANRFGRVSPTNAAHVRADLGDDVDLVLEGGSSRVGVESTIVDLTLAEPVILRVGGLTRSDIERELGRPVARRDTGEVAAPGTLPSHYAPDARVELVSAEELHERAVTLVTGGARVGVLAQAPAPHIAADVVVLEPPRDIEEFARVLYARLRDADAAGLDFVLAVAPPDDGLGAAIRDRLRRASANDSAGPK
jgi:L-threonylcarbamoyladenylate synthase